MALSAPVSRGVGTQVGASATCTVTTTADIAAGSTLILCFGWNTSGLTVSSISDNGPGLTYTVDEVSPNTSTNDTGIASAPCPAGMPAGTVITLTLSGSPTRIAVEVLEETANLSIDKVHTGIKGASSTTWDSVATATTAVADELLIGCVWIASGTVVPTWDAPWTPLTLTAISLNRQMYTAYRIVSATGTYNASGTQDAGASNAANIATYSEAASGTDYVDSGTGLVVFVPSGPDALTHHTTDAGQATVVFAPSGAEDLTHHTTDAGTATVDFIPSASESAQYVDAGSGLVVFDPSGLDEHHGVTLDAGTGLVKFIPSGTDSSQMVESGSGLVIFVPSGVDSLAGITTDAGSSPVVYVPSGTDTLQAVDSGQGTVVFVPRLEDESFGPFEPAHPRYQRRHRDYTP